METASSDSWDRSDPRGLVDRADPDASSVPYQTTTMDGNFLVGSCLAHVPGMRRLTVRALGKRNKTRLLLRSLGRH